MVASLTVVTSAIDALRGREGLLTQLAELAVGNQQGTQGAESIESIVTVLLSGGLVDGSSWQPSSTAVQLLGVPDEVLEQVALVFGEEQDLGVLDHIAKVTNQGAALSRELRRWVG